MEAQTHTKEKQTVKIEDKRSVEIDGIRSISALDEEYIALEGNLGRIVIEGKKLEVLDLARATGRISLKGDITGVYYEAEKERRRKGIFG